MTPLHVPGTMTAAQYLSKLMPCHMLSSLGPLPLQAMAALG